MTEDMYLAGGVDVPCVFSLPGERPQVDQVSVEVNLNLDPGVYLLSTLTLNHSS